jgi:hypothetical protein
VLPVLHNCFLGILRGYSETQPAAWRKSRGKTRDPMKDNPFLWFFLMKGILLA